MRTHGRKALSAVCLFAVAGFLFGCAGREFAPDRQFLYYHKELPAAERALAAAKAAGKDKECPEAYKYAVDMKNDAYKLYEQCKTKEGISKANEAAAMAKGLCPQLPLPTPAKMSPPIPPPAPMAAPTVSLSASPPSIDKGKCADLTWSSTNASRASIDRGIGNVAPGGSLQVCPDATTQYAITATGEGGTKTATTTVTVNPPSPPAAPKVVDRLTVHINFDTNKADVRKEDIPDLQKAVEFVKKYPGHAISVEGHTDDRGNARYNQYLSEKRAVAVKDYLLANGVKDGDKIKTAGFGEDKPIADNKTEKGRLENRRVEILIISK